MKPFIRYSEDVALSKEGPFPAKILLSKYDSSSASVKMGTLKTGSKIETHSHSDSDQLEYYLGGSASMFIEGLGNNEIGQGVFTYIPKGTKHGVIEVKESLTILTIFVPPLF